VDFNRNYIFLVGLILLFLGMEFRSVDSVILNTETSQFITEHFANSTTQSTTDFAPTILNATPLISQRTIQPPQWLGWMLVSLGSVLALHSFVMPRP